MFSILPALILLLLHGPSNFEKLAANGCLPSAVIRGSAVETPAKMDLVSRRALATLIAASGDRALSEAFASMFLARDSRPAQQTTAFKTRVEEPAPPMPQGPEGTLQEGFFHSLRTRDGPAAA